MIKLFIVLLLVILPVSTFAQEDFNLPTELTSYLSEIKPIKQPLQCGDLSVKVYETDGGHHLTLYGRDGVVRAADVRTADHKKVVAVARMVTGVEWKVLFVPSKNVHESELRAAIDQYDISLWSALSCKSQYKQMFAKNENQRSEFGFQY